MGNRASEGGFLRRLSVDMNELMVVGEIGKSSIMSWLIVTQSDTPMFCPTLAMIVMGLFIKFSGRRVLFKVSPSPRRRAMLASKHVHRAFAAVADA